MNTSKQYTDQAYAPEECEQLVKAFAKSRNCTARIVRRYGVYFVECQAIDCAEATATIGFSEQMAWESALDSIFRYQLATEDELNVLADVYSGQNQ